MVGAIFLVVLLLLSPVLITLSLVAVAALFGSTLNSDARARHDHSSLLETNI